MPVQQVLILAMTKMRSGICTAGFTTEPAPVTGLRWVRPVRAFDTLLCGDMTDDDGRLVQCNDVVELNLISPRSDPPHVEDWLVDCVHCRPRCLRRLEGKKRAQFLAKYLDRAPQDVLVHHTRSLCQVHPEQVWANLTLDSYSGKYQVRMGFKLKENANNRKTASKQGVTVTDLKWRALGRTWLTEEQPTLTLQHADVLERLNADDLYLTVGLSRSWQGQYWPLVVGVHAVPDYEATIDLEML
jgi:hypothetical protein